MTICPECLKSEKDCECEDYLGIMLAATILTVFAIIIYITTIN
jgi:hypothetical protein